MWLFWPAAKPPFRAVRPPAPSSGTADDRRGPAGHAWRRCPSPHPTRPRRTFAGLADARTAGHRRGRRSRSRHHRRGARPQHRPTGVQRQRHVDRDRLGGQAVHRRRSAAAGMPRARPSSPPTTARRSTSCCGPPTTAPPRSSGTAAAAARSSTGWSRATACRRPRPPDNGRWFNTISTATDLVRYYDMLLAGTGGLPAEQASIILNDLAHPPRRLPTEWCRRGLSAAVRHPRGPVRRPVAVKQGWMCCIGSRLDAPVHRRDRPGPPLRDGRSARCSPPTTPPRARPSPRRSRRCSPTAGSEPLVRTQRYISRSQCLSGSGHAIPRHVPVRLRTTASSPSRSGRRSRVRATPCSCRHAAIRAWSPESSTSGTSSPRQLGGRV